MPVVCETNQKQISNFRDVCIPIFSSSQALVTIFIHALTQNFLWNTVSAIDGTSNRILEMCKFWFSILIFVLLNDDIVHNSLSIFTKLCMSLGNVISYTFGISDDRYPALEMCRFWFWQISSFVHPFWCSGRILVVVVAVKFYIHRVPVKTSTFFE